ncbi:mammalian cell entry related domain protein [Methylocaldum marinum]|uniref:Mammalian cell entry related domain protein n=1 Tax=Methylocaldum marinum TaxID=1432792 RepID=A0A250KPH0_9GAMM|nr:MlaD family protein [Methylocaldum marinum]BBA33565.1 mammalian cell entry related domain protein [Methylocaldum marinum]
MSRPISPVAIGGFTVGALALLLAAVFIFGGGRFFRTDTVRFVIFFDSSLNGLEIGAPVKMQGVKIGEVKDIVLQFDPRITKIYKPVVIEIDRSNLTGPEGVAFPKARSSKERLASRDRLVAAGFRARLEMQSLLTGLLFIDLDVHRDKPPVFTGLEYQGLLEVPAIPTTADELRNAFTEVAQKFNELPLEDMIRDLSISLQEIKNFLTSQDARRSTAALAHTLEETEKAVKTLNGNLAPLLANMNRTVANANTLIGDVRPIVANADKALIAATAALDGARDSMAKLDGAIGSESALYETLDALKEAARSIRNLTDYLERHPEAVLTGKGH